MRRSVCQVTIAASAAMRFNATKRYDLFGYEVDTNTNPWIEKISKVKHFDLAGELLVQMNVVNCPPDLATYNATLGAIHKCERKEVEGVVDNESKFCAMMDLLEEMDHRNKIAPNAESWKWVMKECVASNNFRLGFVIQEVLNKNGGCPADLAAANDANAAKAKAEGKEHPSHLAKQTALFDTLLE